MQLLFCWMFAPQSLWDNTSSRLRKNSEMHHNPAMATSVKMMRLIMELAPPKIQETMSN